MDSTFAHGPDSAFIPDDALPLVGTRANVEPLKPEAARPTSSPVHWLDQAMALWLRDPQEEIAMPPQRTTH